MRAGSIVLDGLDVLLAHLGGPAQVRRELFRLREWVYESGLTCVLTAKADPHSGASQTDFDFLQFASDCVIHLQHRLAQGAAVRTLRVTKYRGAAHSANEFPFTITSSGIEVASGTTAVLQHRVSTARVTTGVEQLDAMLGGGYFRGTSVLISGAPGTSKTSLSASFADAACRRKERTVYVSFDEAPEQIVRNVASIGVDLERHLRAGVLAMCSLRARADNPDAHVARIRRLLHEHRAVNLCVDPISALSVASDPYVADRAAVQVLDIAKGLGVTTVSTSLLANSAPLSEETPIGISTIADTWMHVSYVSQGGERNRALTIIKSRGMKHSNQVRELVLDAGGVTLADAYSSGGEVLMGTLRWEKENEDRRATALATFDSELRQKQAEGALAETRARVEAARAELALREAELRSIVAARRTTEKGQHADQTQRSTLRGARARNGAHLR